MVAYAYYVAHSALPQLDGRLRDQRISGTGHGDPRQPMVFRRSKPPAWKTFSSRRATSQRRTAFGRWTSCAALAAANFRKFWARTRSSSTASSGSWACEPRPGSRWRWRTRATASFFEAYARGVNAYIGTHRDHLPMEFRILRYTPKPWLAEDSLVIANSMVKDLNYHYFYDTLAREKILAKLGPELTADLYVNRSWHDRPPTVMREDLNEPDSAAADSDDGRQRRRRSAGQLGHAEEFRRRLAVEGLPVSGSNDWVVSGAHTVTGKPLLSNDMHLGHQMPNLWYEAHLHSGTLDVAGVTLPGMPYVSCRATTSGSPGDSRTSVRR